MLCDRAVIFAILVISLQIPWLYAIQCTVEPADVVEVPPQGVGYRCDIQIWAVL